VFSMQRGVRNGGILKDGLRGVGASTKKPAAGIASSSGSNSGEVAVVEGLVGFACVPVPFPANVSVSLDGSPQSQNSYLACTHTSPKIMLERLSKEIARVADGPVNLLETLDFEILYRKTLTPYAWGTLMYENMFALNIITGGDLRDTIRCRKHRLVLAFMIRESREVN
jgi:hypothetical protein